MVLRDAYPNPLVNQTQLGFTIARPETISLDILTLNGQWVKQVAEGTLEAGYPEITPEREGLSAEAYLCRLIVFIRKGAANRQRPFVEFPAPRPSAAVRHPGYSGSGFSR